MFISNALLATPLNSLWRDDYSYLSHCSVSKTLCLLLQIPYNGTTIELAIDKHKMNEESVIKKVMDKFNINPEDIPDENYIEDPMDPKEIEIHRKSKRYFRTRAEADYGQHDECERTWHSVHSWSVIDLKKQKFHGHYGQDCRECGETLTPFYEEDEIEEMTERACRQYLIRIGELERSPATGSGGQAFGKGPHEQKLCGMCKKLGHECWK